MSHRLDGFRHQTPVQRFFKPNGGGGRDLTGAGSSSRGHDSTVEEEVQAVGDGSLPQERSPRVVTDLMTGAGHTEDLVDPNECKEREHAHPGGQCRGGKRFNPSLSPPRCRQSSCGQRPGRGLEHIPISWATVSEHMLDIVGQAPHLELAHQVDGHRGYHLVVVVDQLEQGLFDVTRTRLEQ